MLDSTALADLAKRLGVTATLFREGRMLPPAFLADLDKLHTESLAIRNGAHKPPADERQADDRAKALLSWARDCKTQEYILRKKIQIDRKTQWRWIDSDECEGMINGLPSCRGIPRITNGILVVVERADGTTFTGHIDWFDKEKREKERAAKAKQEKVNKTLHSMEDYIGKV